MKSKKFNIKHHSFIIFISISIFLQLNSIFLLLLYPSHPQCHLSHALLSFSELMLLSLSCAVFIDLHKKLTSSKLHLNLQQIRYHLNEMKRNYNCLSIPFTNRV